MKSDAKLVKFLSWNTINFATLTVVSLLSLPVYYGKLSPENFAILSIVWSALAISTVMDLGVGRALTRELGAITNESASGNYKSVASSGIVVAGVYSALAALIVQFGISKYFDLLDDQYIIEQQTIAMVALAIFATLASNAFLAIFEGMHRIQLATLIRISFTFFYMAGPAAMLALSVTDELSDVVLLIALARLAQLAACILIASRLVVISFAASSYRHVKDLLANGMWLTLSNIVSIAMTSSDRFILGYYRSPTDLGNYVIASELIQRGVGVLSIISGSIFPLIARAGPLDGHGQRLRVAHLLISVVGISVFFLGFFLINQFLVIWLGRDDVLQIAHLFQIMLVGWLASGFGQLYLANIHSMGDTRTPALVHVAEAMFAIPAMIYAIYDHGVYGGAAVWTVRAVVDALILKFVSGRRR